jgi:hypothetical protein
MTQENQPREATLTIDEDRTYSVLIDGQRQLQLNHHAYLNQALHNLWRLHRDAYNQLAVPSHIGTRHALATVLQVLLSPVQDPGPDEPVGRLYRQVSQSPTLEGVNLDDVRRHITISCHDVVMKLDSLTDDHRHHPYDEQLRLLTEHYPNDLYVPPQVF